MISLSSTNEEILAEMERIRVLYKLKTTLRYKSSRDGSSYSESVAEHLYGLHVLAHYFLLLEDSKKGMDPMRVDELILFHELGEIETGDISFHEKTDGHRAEERLAADRVVAKIPESMQPLARDRLREFEECKTPEAKFATALDKIEPIFELYDESELSLYRKQNISQRVAMRVKYDAAVPYPYMIKFIEAWEERAVSLDTFPA